MKKIVTAFIILLCLCQVHFLCISVADFYELSSGSTDDGMNAFSHGNPLAYNEAVIIDGTLHSGSNKWLALSEAVLLYPSVAVPQLYNDCALEACSFELNAGSYVYQESRNPVTIPVIPGNIKRIRLLYSDGLTGYCVDFFTAGVRDDYERIPVAQDGFIIKEQETGIVMGVLQQNHLGSVYIFDGDAMPVKNEVEPGLFVSGIFFGTSQLTEFNAEQVFRNPEFINLLQGLYDFVKS